MQRKVTSDDRTCGINPTRRFRTHKWGKRVVVGKGTNGGHPFHRERRTCECGAYEEGDVFQMLLAGTFRLPSGGAR